MDADTVIERKNKMAAAESTVEKLFTELNNLAQIGEYGKAQKVANKSKMTFLKLEIQCSLNETIKG